MRQLLRQFSQGVVDALRIPDAFITILSDRELRWLNLKCFVLNGMLYLGAELVYMAFTTMLFDPSARGEVSSDSSFIWQAVQTIVHFVMDFMHNSWVMGI